MQATRWAPAVILAVLAGSNCSSAAFAQAATCDWYANTALQQQKINIERKCGFKGESWSFDRNSHIVWCQSVAPHEWRRQAQFREQELTKCETASRR